ncbi:DUF4269 domain-containing protein [Paenibacillus albiflavus]|uniref:DUF4269 domain-containing protein n=1 Tax=Paenibacillus albiflavus TaxID=2545760 RepID=A0A4R4EPE8_9BACL|nr:DUF4269 domain-containing protein [Paenibacillus albiflavus]TCZ80258.1 DUF4269 domain-containing protein [Paenibacillus albiflavus]
MFTDITYLRNGNEKQQQVYQLLTQMHLFENLASYKPVLCGTIPIAIDNENSDLDIIMEVYDFAAFKSRMNELFGSYDEFKLQEKLIRSTPTIKVNFNYGGFMFELFGQPKAVAHQNAYRHMIIEHHLLNLYPDIREEIIRLKKAGMKTEPAFAQVLGLNGDPYEELLKLKIDKVQQN